MPWEDILWVWGKKKIFPIIVTNYLNKIGSNLSIDEIYSSEQLVEKFNIKSFSKNSVLFNDNDLERLNSRYLKTLTYDKLAENYFLEGSQFLTTYYGQLSLKELNISPNIELDDGTKFSKEYEKEFEKNKLIKIVKILKELDQT